MRFRDNVALLGSGGQFLRHFNLGRRHPACLGRRRFDGSCRIAIKAGCAEPFAVDNMRGFNL
jgi:hypothetical protein